MSNKFVVGEICLGRAKSGGWKECVVIWVPTAETRYFTDGPTWGGGTRVAAGHYVVRASEDGMHYAPPEEYLRKRPGDDKTDYIPPAIRALFAPIKTKELIQ